MPTFIPKIICRDFSVRLFSIEIPLLLSNWHFYFLRIFLILLSFFMFQTVEICELLLTAQRDFSSFFRQPNLRQVAEQVWRVADKVWRGLSLWGQTRGVCQGKNKALKSIYRSSTRYFEEFFDMYEMNKSRLCFDVALQNNRSPDGTALMIRPC